LSKNRKKKHINQASPNHLQEPNCLESPKWPSIYPVRIEKSVDDENQYTEDKKYKDRQIIIARWLNWITAVGAIAAIAYGMIAYGQWRDAHSNFLIDQRAWVGPTSVIQPEFKEPNSFSITTLIANTGKTPARNFRSKYSWNIILKDGPFQPNYDSLQGTLSNSVIFPNGQLALISVPIRLDEANLNRVTVTGEAFLYVYGELTYDDIFQSTHTTHFCMFYDRSLKPGTCSTYNDAN
jgi:hypothetical protein